MSVLLSTTISKVDEFASPESKNITLEVSSSTKESSQRVTFTAWNQLDDL